MGKAKLNHQTNKLKSTKLECRNIESKQTQEKQFRKMSLLSQKIQRRIN